MASSRTFNLSQGTSLGRIATFAAETATGAIKDQEKPEGSLANTLRPTAGGGQINVVKQYRWTLSQTLNREDVPYVRLIEYKCTESSIKKQFDFYAKGVIPSTAGSALGVSAETKEVLDVYKEIFPKDHPTDFSYWFPYFSKTGFDLSTPNWESLDSIGGAISDITGGIDKTLGTKVGGLIKGATDLASAGANALMNVQYPSVGVADRPKIFMGHNDRTINISFTLFNTVDEGDWIWNRDLIYLLMSQNLFNKRDYVTGVPPVFYDIYIPGQYYCYAAAMTDIKIENVGNQRLLYHDFIVPDAYQVNLTLTELVKPSKNQFEAITNGAGRSFVNSSTVKSVQDEVNRTIERNQANKAAAANQMAATSRSATNKYAKKLPNT